MLAQRRLVAPRIFEAAKEQELTATHEVPAGVDEGIDRPCSGRGARQRQAQRVIEDGCDAQYGPDADWQQDGDQSRGRGDGDEIEGRRDESDGTHRTQLAPAIRPDPRGATVDLNERWKVILPLELMPDELRGPSYETLGPAVALREPAAEVVDGLARVDADRHGVLPDERPGVNAGRPLREIIALHGFP